MLKFHRFTDNHRDARRTTQNKMVCQMLSDLQERGSAVTPRSQKPTVTETSPCQRRWGFVVKYIGK